MSVYHARFRQPVREAPLPPVPAAPLREMPRRSCDGRCPIFSSAGATTGFSWWVESGINVYGCTPTPRPDVAEFASSTATTISKRAIDRAERAQAELAERAESEGIETAFESRIEELRAELRATLRISEETEIVFAPSGTDGALFAVFLARALLGAPIDNIMMVSDETGRGIPFASIGRHFSSLHGARQFGDEG